MEDDNTTAGLTRGSGASTATGSGDTDRSRGIADRVRERATAQLSNQKDRATDGLGTVAQAVRQSTQRLREQQHDTVAQYVEQAADQIERFTNGLKQKDVGQIVEDTQRLARRRPALFIGGAFALGVIGARFLKSSPPEHRGAYGYGSSGEATGEVYREREPLGRSTGAITGTARDNPGTEIY
jgi:hypothetical protein